MDTVLQGLFITLVGMGLVFLALGLIVVAMELMGRYLRPRPTPAEETAAPESDRQDRARVAAMAAAIVMAQEPDERYPGEGWRAARMGDMPSPWQASHRAQTLAHRPEQSGEGGTHR